MAILRRTRTVLLLTLASACSAVAGAPISGRAQDSLPLSNGSTFLESSATARTLEENASFVLAAERTRRRDPLDGFKFYTGGWNISDLHYLASVGYSAAPLFAVAIVWSVGFGLLLALICCCYCCFPKRGSSHSSATCALVLFAVTTLFTVATIIGCVVLFRGQERFHGSTSATLRYVVGQSNATVHSLRNFSSILADTKKIGVNQFSLPADQKARIDAVVRSLDAAANDLSSRTRDNSRRIQNYLDTVRLILIVAVAALLLLVLIGLILSILGMRVLVHVLVVVGWILVAATLFLSGVFLLLHNAVADACVAMDEWVLHPREHTAMDDILPCVDSAAASASLNQSREVMFQVAEGLNQIITNVSNANYSPAAGPLYYNQSGPLLPVLCNPYNPDTTNRSCAAGEIAFKDAAQVWSSYVCQVATVNGSDLCATVGRLTPTMYAQMAAAVNVSYGVLEYGPFLAELADCTFLRGTFRSISNSNCPDLARHGRQVYTGLTIASAAVMVSLVLWLVGARSRREDRKQNSQFWVSRTRSRCRYKRSISLELPGEKIGRQIVLPVKIC